MEANISDVCKKARGKLNALTRIALFKKIIQHCIKNEVF